MTTETYQPGDIIRRTDPMLNPTHYRVLRAHSTHVTAKPLDGGAAIHIPVVLIERVEVGG
jgi:hypothetical protein